MANLPSFGSIKTSLGNLCLPSQIYLGLSVLALIFAAVNSFSVITIITKVIFIALWTFILNWICQKGYESISWALVILPYVLLILMLLLGGEIVGKNMNKVAGEPDKTEEKQPVIQKPSVVTEEKPPVVTDQNPTVVSGYDLYSTQNRQYLTY